MSDINNIIPIELKRAIANNRLIVFVGAGLSSNLKNTDGKKLEGWTDLVKEIIGHLIQEGYKIDNLLPLLDDYEPIKVLDLIESNKKFSKSIISSFVKKFLQLDTENDFKLHQLICSLSNKIITTNYDTAFELANPTLRNYKAYKGKNYELTLLKDPKASLLFKLHGCFEDIQSMVLFPSEYDKLYKNSNNTDAEHALVSFKNIIHNNSVLFIGTGMGDYQINTLFQQIKKLQGEYNQKHFVITTKNLDSSLNFLIPVLIEKHSDIPEIIKELIQIKEESRPEKEKELEEQLITTKRKLEEVEKEIENSSSTVEKQAKQLKREGLRCFQRGLDYASSGFWNKAIEENVIAIDLIPLFYEAYYNLGVCYVRLSFEDKDKIKLQTAIIYLEKSIKINSVFFDGYRELGTVLGELGKLEEKAKQESLFNRAFENYEEAIKINPESIELYFNWGNYLGILALKKEGQEQIDYFNLTFQKFEEAIRLSSYKESTVLYDIYNNWGNAIEDYSETKVENEREEFLNEAIKKYQKAISVDSNRSSAYINWGYSLTSLAEINKDKLTKENLYRQAVDKIHNGLIFSPKDYGSLNNYGHVLAELALLKSGEERQNLLQEAISIFEKAISINENFELAYDNWGNCLLELHETTENKEEKIELLNLAHEMLNIAVSKGASTYNLACCLALKEQKEDAFELLEKVLKQKEITGEEMIKDNSWTKYLDDNNFKALLAKY